MKILPVPCILPADGRRDSISDTHDTSHDPNQHDPMNLDKQSIATVDVAGKRVLMRVDFNVPQDKSGAITNNQVCLCHGELAPVGCTSYT